MTTRVVVGVLLVVLILSITFTTNGVDAQVDWWEHLPIVHHLPGKALTGVGIQNTDRSEAALIAATFYPQVSGALPTLVQANADPGVATFLYLPSSPLPEGTFAATIHTDRRVAAIARTDWPASGSAAIYSQAIPEAHVIVPLATKQYGSQCSSVSIQNTSAAASTDAVAEFYAMGDSTPTLEKDLHVGAGTSTTLRLCEDADLGAQLPDGFIGSIQVKSKDGVTRLAVQSSVEIYPEKRATYAFEGVPLETADSVLFAPLFRASQPLGTNRYGSTGISVTNTGGDDVEVSVTFRPDYQAREACGHSPFQQQKTLPAFSNVVFWQGPGGGPVPAGCFGSATISASDNGMVLAVVVDSVDDQASGRYNIASAAYNAFGREQAGRLYALPLFRTGHTRHNLWTGVSVMNVSAEDADVSLSVMNSVTGESFPNAMSATLPPYETVNLWPHSIGYPYEPPWGDPNQAYGSAIIVSDQPVVVIVNDSAQTRDPALQIDAATYAGIRLE